MAVKTLRVALCQINTTIGSFGQNVERICTFLAKAGELKADLAVFPELCISSYPPLDLLDRPEFHEANARALEELRKRLAGMPNVPQAAVIGSILPNPSATGRVIQNGAVVLYRGQVVATQAKRLLPTYDVFDEARYFEPGTETRVWDSPWGKLGLSVCEDAWFEATRHYRSDPAESLRGCDLVINISSSPFEINKHDRRKELLAGFVRRAGAPLVYVNQVGGNDEILFDGASVVAASDGSPIFEMPAFREGIAVLNLSLGPRQSASGAEIWINESSDGAEIEWKKSASPAPDARSAKSASDPTSLCHEALVTGIRDYFRKTGFKKAVVGLSGGIDSAVVACLAAEALGPKNVLAVMITSQFTASQSVADAEAIARASGIEFRVMSLKFVFTTLLMELKPAFGGAPPDVTEENIQARLRATFLMGLANKRGALLLTTGNKSELATGYCTIYGDMAGALAPLGDVYKTRVYQVAREINARHGWIPESVLVRPPSAELRANQKDEDSLGPYADLDRLLELHFEGLQGEEGLIKAGFDPAYVRKILALIRTTEFKRRQAAPVLKVTSKAFGLGRRMPVAKSFA